MTTPVAEIPKSPEIADQTKQTLDWLTYAGNSERNLLTLLVLSEADQPLSKTGLYHALVEKSDSDSLPGDNALAFQACSQNLTKIEAVQPEPAEAMILGKIPRIVNGFEITPSGREFGVPFAGALLTWSLKHPELSLRLFGQSGGRNAARAPLVRFWTLYDLVTDPDADSEEGAGVLKSPSVSYLASHLELGDSARGATVDRLTDIGLLSKESALEDNTRQFRIVQPDYITGHRKGPYEKLLPETKMLYETFKIAHQVKDTWGQDEFLRLMIATFPDADEATVKAAALKLVNGFSASTTSFNGVLEAVDGKQYEGLTKVSIKPEFVPAIQELVEVIDAFCSGDPKAIEAGKEAASDILASPDKFDRLYTKSFESSNLAVKDEAIDQKLVGIIATAGQAVTAKVIHDAYVEATGRNVSMGNIRAKLGQLVANGQLDAQTQSHSKIKQRKEPHYIIPAREQTDEIDPTNQ